MSHRGLIAIAAAAALSAVVWTGTVSGGGDLAAGAHPWARDLVLDTGPVTAPARHAHAEDLRILPAQPARADRIVAAADHAPLFTLRW